MKLTRILQKILKRVANIEDGIKSANIFKDAPVYLIANKRKMFTESGSFTAPVSGYYKITLQGGGGGGSGAGTDGASVHSSGAGGGGGAHYSFFEYLNKNETYTFSVGAGGKGGEKGSTGNSSTPKDLGYDGQSGGATTITINSNVYVAGGGSGATNGYSAWRQGYAGTASKNGEAIHEAQGFSGTPGKITPASRSAHGGTGGGQGGGTEFTSGLGAGGYGGLINFAGTYFAGRPGGQGYILFEWYEQETK